MLSSCFTALAVNAYPLRSLTSFLPFFPMLLSFNCWWRGEEEEPDNCLRAVRVLRHHTQRNACACVSLRPPSSHTTPLHQHTTSISTQESHWQGILPTIPILSSIHHHLFCPVTFISSLHSQFHSCSSFYPLTTHLKEVVIQLPSLMDQMNWYIWV